MDAEEGFELTELCDLAGVTPRTVRYYVQQGLLPSPGMGPGTKYRRGHLDRLRLIRRLQKEHLPLAEIRSRLERLDDDEVTEVLAAGDEPDEWAGIEAMRPPPPLAVRSPVGDYVDDVLGARRDEPRRRRTRPSTGKGSEAAAIERDRWDRYRLADDVELHVRRPLSRETNRRVERLIEAARRILGEEP